MFDRLRSSEMQEILKDPVETIDLPDQNVCKFLLRVIRGNPITQDFRGPLDGTERVAYFMGHPGRKLAEGGETVCAAQLFFDLDDLVGLLPELLVAALQGLSSLLVTDPLLLFALGEKPGQAAYDIVKDNFQ